MTALFVLIVGLGVPGLLPAVAVAGRSPAVIFLAPIVGAAMAAVATELELAFPGSLLTHYEQVAITVNALVIGWWVAGRLLRKSGLAPLGPIAPWSRPPWAWSVLTVVVIVAALRLPLEGLRAELIGWDANSIWLTHALMVSDGHNGLLAGLVNKTYAFSNPDYPPLVPAVGALAFAFYGKSHLYLAINMTELVAACGLGLTAAGITAAAEGGRWFARIPAMAAAAAICVAGFAVAGTPGLSGYADLPWAAAAVAAIIWGLVAPKSTQALIISWICAIAASLIKNEGLTSALAIIVLIALRYRPLAWPRLRPYRKGRFVCMHCVKRAALRIARAWAERAGLVVVPALPGLIWVEQIHHIGLSDQFFGASSSESIGTRASATISSMAHWIDVAPVALALLLVGSVLLRKDRKRLGIANPAWLWLATAAGLSTIFVTYLVGWREIHTWLHSSVDRTTVFAQLALYADIAVWLVIACEAAVRWEPGTLPWRPRGLHSRSERERSGAERAREAALTQPAVGAETAEADLSAGTLVPVDAGTPNGDPGYADAGTPNGDRRYADTGSSNGDHGYTAIGSHREFRPSPDEPELSHDGRALADRDRADRAAELAGFGPPES